MTDQRDPEKDSQVEDRRHQTETGPDSGWGNNLSDHGEHSRWNHGYPDAEQDGPYYDHGLVRGQDEKDGK